MAYDDNAWNSEEALNNLKMEAVVHGDETEEQLARRLFRESAPQVVLGVIHTALHEANASTRLKAQQYVVDRVLGRVGDDLAAGTNPLEDALRDFMERAEVYANTGATSANGTNDTNEAGI